MSEIKNYSIVIKVKNMRNIKVRSMRTKPPTQAMLRMRAQLVKRIKHMCGGK